MNEIEIKWVMEAGKKYITFEAIGNRIEINEDNKEIKNAKAFFREIIYQCFLNDCNNRIILVDDEDNEISEVKTIINELIQLCNKEIEAKGQVVG